MFQTTFQTYSGDHLCVEFVLGRLTFLMGANGTGKSTLMDLIAEQNRNRITRAYAHRSVTLDSSSVSLTGSSREQFETNITHVLSQKEYRYRGDFGGQTVNTLLYDIHAAEAKFSANQLKKLNALDPRTVEGLTVWESSRKDLSPFQRLERILNAAGLRLSLDVDERGTIRAVRDGHEPYGIQELSDGERAAFLLAATVITAPTGRLVLIDEPERHLHRSISSPLIHALLSERPDCAFVISTHDIGLSLDQPESSALLLREYRHQPQAWRVDYFGQVEAIDNQVAEAILGARRTILFVEGERNSLDQALYTQLFPNTTVRAHSSCKDVINATRGVNETMGDHWIRAVGIIDRDRRTDDDVDQLARHGVVALEVHAIESVYYHPTVIRLVANRLDRAGLIKFDEVDRELAKVMVKAFVASRDILIRDAAVRRVRNAVLSQLPTANDFVRSIYPSAGLSSGEVETLHKEEIMRFDELAASSDVDGLCAAYPVKRTGVIKAVCNLLKLKDGSAYAETVRRMAIDDDKAAEVMRKLFGPLAQHVKSAQESTEAEAA
jgi:ABC-type Mn2+/Zn2+ transport system ATPase subunit